MYGAGRYAPGDRLVVWVRTPDDEAQERVRVVATRDGDLLRVADDDGVMWWIGREDVIRRATR
jgi:hypothetical protein